MYSRLKVKVTEAFTDEKKAKSTAVEDFLDWLPLHWFALRSSLSVHHVPFKDVTCPTSAQGKVQTAQHACADPIT